jgi:hypothetical protein
VSSSTRSSVGQRWKTRSVLVGRLATAARLCIRTGSSRAMRSFGGQGEHRDRKMPWTRASEWVAGDSNPQLRIKSPLSIDCLRGPSPS